MAPKAISNLQPSKKKEDTERPVSSEEEEEDVHESEEEVEEDDEENSSGNEEEDSSEEEEEDRGKVTQKAQISSPKVPSKSILKQNGPDLDSEPESNDSPSVYKLQPIPRVSIAKSKRSHDEVSNNQHSSKSNKRAKTEEKKSGATVSSTPASGCISRVWSDGDEIDLLKGLIEFKNLKNGDVGGVLYDIIKGKLKLDFSREQLRTKVSRMKKRFLNALKRGHNGSEPVFSKPHDVMVFDLSKKVWGDVDGKNESSKGYVSEGVYEKSKIDTLEEENVGENEKGIVKYKKDDEERIMWSKYPFFFSSFVDVVKKFPSLEISDFGMSFVKEKLSLLGNAAAEELNEKWKQMFVEETELHYKMLTLMREQIRLALNQ